MTYSPAVEDSSGQCKAKCYLVKRRVCFLRYVCRQYLTKKIPR